MVTHDAVVGSYASRVLFLKDGKIWSELDRGERDRQTMYSEILNVLSALGGDTEDVYKRQVQSPGRLSAETVCPFHTERPQETPAPYFYEPSESGQTAAVGHLRLLHNPGSFLSSDR